MLLAVFVKAQAADQKSVALLALQFLQYLWIIWNSAKLQGKKSQKIYISLFGNLIIAGHVYPEAEGKPKYGQESQHVIMYRII